MVKVESTEMEETQTDFSYIWEIDSPGLGNVLDVGRQRKGGITVYFQILWLESLDGWHNFY